MSFFVLGCQNEVLSAPSLGRRAVLSYDTDAPQQVKASYGKRRSIEVSWESKKDTNIRSYEIYSSNSIYSPDSDWIKKDEVQAKNADERETWTDKTVEAGVQRCYKVRAVYFDGEYSGFSENVMGTSLAIPQMYYIEMADPNKPENGQVRVKWQMNYSDEYIKNTKYKLVCYSSEHKENIYKFEGEYDVAYDGDLKELTGVLGNSGPQLGLGENYSYQVTAYLIDDENQFEVSALETQKTAYSKIPLAAERFSVSKGISDTEIVISWDLPRFVYISDKAVQKAKPLWFRLERKEVQDDDISYSAIIDYIGVMKKTLSGNEFRIDCRSGETDDTKNGEITDGTSANPKRAFINNFDNVLNNKLDEEYRSDLKDDFTHYIPDTRITFYDRTVQRGKQYTYRVISYVDDENVDYDSAKGTFVGKSIISDRGHLIFISQLAVKNTPKNAKIIDDEGEEVDDNEHYAKTTVDFTLGFNTLGVDYTYFIARKYKAFTTGATYSEPEIIGMSKKLKKVQSKQNTWKLRDENNQDITDVFEFSGDDDATKKSQDGYYKYEIIICPNPPQRQKNPGEVDDPPILNKESSYQDVKEIQYTSSEITGEGVPISYESKFVPKIDGFTVIGGYPDHFRVMWFFDASNGRDVTNYKTNLYWTDSSGNKSSLSNVSYSSSLQYYKDMLTEEEQNLGVTRRYTLEAINTVGSGTYKVTSVLDYDVMSLSKPIIIQGDFDYSVINIVWREAQGCYNESAAKGHYDVKVWGDGVEGHTTESNALVSNRDSYKGYFEMYYLVNKDGQLIKSETSEITEGDETYVSDGVIHCVLKELPGFNKTSFAGKDINVKVVGHSASDSAITVDSKIFTTRLIGPAKLNVGVNETTPYVDKIEVSWDEVEGAEAYFVARAEYKAVQAKEVSRLSAYYVKSEDYFSLIGAGTQDKIDTSKVFVTKKVVDGKTRYTLTDGTDGTLPNSDSNYRKSQANIVLGRPYGYVVLPLKKGDGGADFLPPEERRVSGCNKDSKGSVGLNDEAPVVYDENKIVSKKWATYGFGQKIKASKFYDPKKIKVTWEKPYLAVRNAPDSDSPLLYRRKVTLGGNGWSHADWENVSGMPDGSVSFDDYLKRNNKNPSRGELCSTYEYVVSYIPTSFMPSTNFINGVYGAEDAALREEIDTDSRYGSGVADADKEQLNKGYTSTLESFYAGAAPNYPGYNASTQYYAEKVEFSPWNYDKRKIGPTEFVLQIKNYNVDDAWHDLSRINATKNGDFAREDELESDIVIQTANSNAKNELFIWPKAIKDATNPAQTNAGQTSMLKVLRDYKHYYCLETRRSDSGNAGGSFDRYGDDGSVFAFRNVTDEELVRAATLAMAMSMRRGNPKSKNSDDWSRVGEPSRTTNSSAGGSLYIKWHSKGVDWLTHRVVVHENSWTNYIFDNITTKANVSVNSFFKINGSVEGAMTGNHAQSTPPNTYKGTVTITNILNNEVASINFPDIDENDDFTITRNNKTTTFKNSTTMTPFPYEDLKDDKYFFDSEECWK